LHVAVQEPSVTSPVPQSHVKVAPTGATGAVQVSAVQVGFVDDIAPAGQEADVELPE
jgi:hypothetical protein